MELLPQVIDAAAHARFLMVEPAFKELLAIQFRTTRQAELVHALKVKNAQLGKLLASYGFDVNAKNEKGETALTWAKKQKNGEELETVLRQAGAR